MQTVLFGLVLPAWVMPYRIHCHSLASLFAPSLWLKCCTATQALSHATPGLSLTIQMPAHSFFKKLLSSICNTLCPASTIPVEARFPGLVECTVVAGLNPATNGNPADSGQCPEPWAAKQLATLLLLCHNITTSVVQFTCSTTQVIPATGLSCQSGTQPGRVSSEQTFCATEPT